MKTILSNRGVPIVVDDESYPHMTTRKWQVSSSGYAKRSTTVGGKNVTELMHRIIINAGPGDTVDHINGNRLDNRRSNLRICTVSQNAANMALHRNNTTGFKGVHTTPRSSSFESKITHRRHQYYIGRFRTAAEAARAYDKKARELFGDYAKLNFPEGI